MTTTSELQLRVSKELNEMQVEHELEATTEDGTFAVDIMLREPRIVLEVEGPSHYTVNTGRRLGAPRPDGFCRLCVCLHLTIAAAAGSAVMRSRLLEAQGWHVIPIPFFQWNRAGTTDSHADYLWSLLPPSVAEARSSSATQQPAAAAA